VKAAKGSLGRSLDQPDPKVRFYLFYGPDEGQSRAHGERLLKGLGADRFAVASGAAKSDPAILADEACAIGLFGGKRAIWVEPAGDEIVPAVEALLEAGAAESPVIAIAGALRKTSPLLQLADANPLALSHISYELSERDAVDLVEELGRGEGLGLTRAVAARIASAAGNERAIVAQELAKIALYLDASPESPVEVDAEVLDAIGAGSEGDTTRLVDLALSGELAALSREIDATAADAEPIVVLRALQRRLLMLAPIRARVEQGSRPHDAVTSAGKSVFWKEKEVVTRMIAAWSSEKLARVVERSGELERRLMGADSPPPSEALEEELLAIARMAGRR
jgi:DNA polymerase-3 subunit delta